MSQIERRNLGQILNVLFRQFLNFQISSSSPTKFRESGFGRMLLRLCPMPSGGGWHSQLPGIGQLPNSRECRNFQRYRMLWWQFKASAMLLIFVPRNEWRLMTIQIEKNF
jgi:hypothetical protein